LHSHKGIENLTSELGAALSAARRAGEVLRAGFGAEHTITYKGRWTSSRRSTRRRSG
jgi:hypothetical protein